MTWRLGGDALCEVGRGRPDASGVADGGLDRDPGGGRCPGGEDPLDKLVRIGIDEIYKKGHKYLVVVVDHDTGKLVWAKPGRDKKTLGAFFDVVGEERCRQDPARLGDWAGWIATVVADRCKNATRCMESFSCGPVVHRRPRRGPPRGLERSANEGMKTLAGDSKGARFALWKNPEDLTANQEARLSWVQATNQRLYRAYLLKEQLRQVFKLRGDAGIAPPKVWLAWASGSKLEAFVELARSIRNHRAPSKQLWFTASPTPGSRA